MSATVSTPSEEMAGTAAASQSERRAQAWAIIGRHHRLVYELIVDAAMSRPADICPTVRISARNGQLAIAALAAAGLVVRDGRSVAAGPVTLDDIAAAHHLDDAQAQRLARCRRERAAWHAWLALQDQLKIHPINRRTCPHDAPGSRIPRHR